MAVEAERLLAVMEVQLRNMDIAIQKINGGTKAFDTLTAAGTKAEKAVAKVGAGAAGFEKVERAAKGASIQTSNLAAQFNDIGVQLAGGQSPFLIALQQGTQITQALGPAGAGAAVRALGGAFVSMLNPVSLATIAIIGLGGTAVQYFTEMVAGGEQSNEVIKQQAALIEAVASKWGDVIPAVRTLADELKRAADEQDRMAAKQIITDRNFAPVREKLPAQQIGFAGVLGDIQDLGLDPARIAEIQDAFSTLNSRIAEGTATTEDLKNVQGELNTLYAEMPINSVGEMLTQLEQFAPTLGESVAAQKETNEQFAIITLSAQDAKEMAAALAAELIGLGPSGSGAVQEIVSSITGSLIPALGSAGERLGALLQEFQNFQNAANTINAQMPGNLGALAPLESGGGKFLNADEAQTARANAAKSQTQIAAEAAAKKASRSGGGRSRAISEAQREQEAVTKLIDSLQFERSTIGMTDLEREKAVALRRAGSAATAEQRSQIESLTGQIYAEEQAQKRADQAARDHKQSMEELGRIGANAAQGLVDALSDGKLEASELLSIVTDVVNQLIQMGGQNGSGLGSLFSSLFGGGNPLTGHKLGVGLYHSGGVVGRPSQGRSVSPSLFNGAQRYHEGGVAGLKPGEVPAILQRGEIVLPKMPGRQQSSGSFDASRHYNIDARGAEAGVEDKIRSALEQYDRGSAGRLARDFPEARRRGFIK